MPWRVLIILTIIMIMRTIKFRGKSNDIGKWLFGNLVDSGLTKIKDYFILPEDASNYDEFEKVIPESVGQFTGLTDKNGKEIYEGDILTYQNGSGPEKVVEYCSERGYYKMKFLQGGGFVDTLYYYLERDCEIIGNIHENSELL